MNIQHPTSNAQHPMSCGARNHSSVLGLHYWVWDLGCGMLDVSWNRRFNRLQEPLDYGLHVDPFRFGAVIEQNAMPERGVSEGLDVIHRDMGAAFQERAGLGAEHEKLSGARAGAPTGP